MLVVLAASPRASPAKTMFDKLLIAEVGLRYSVSERFAAIGVWYGLGWIDYHFAVCVSLDMRVVERVDVNGKSLAMLGEFGASFDLSEVETRRIIGLHRTGIICVIFVYQHHAFDRIMCMIERTEDAEQVVCNALMTYEFAQLRFAIGIVVEYFEIAKVGAL